MAAKSAIDQFAASIIVKVSIYLTACLGVLLAILILFRQLEGIGATGPTLAEELLTLLVTLGLTYSAVWCAGFLAILSTKNKLLRPKEPKVDRPVAPSGQLELTKSTTDIAELVPNETSMTGPNKA